MRIKIYRGKSKKEKVDWVGVAGFDKAQKTREHLTGFCCEVVFEPSNNCLRIYTNGKYQYLTYWQTKQLLKQLLKELPCPKHNSKVVK